LYTTATGITRRTFEENKKGGNTELERNMTHPNFLLGLISSLLLIAGVFVLASEREAGRIVILTSIFLGAIHWVGSMISVCKDHTLKKEETSRYFWLSLVIIIPPIAGMLYYMADDKKVS
jgi:prolipoprotein diacylglyceryltransferase